MKNAAKETNYKFIITTENGIERSRIIEFSPKFSMELIPAEGFDPTEESQIVLSYRLFDEFTGLRLTGIYKNRQHVQVNEDDRMKPHYPEYNEYPTGPLNDGIYFVQEYNGMLESAKRVMSIVAKEERGYKKVFPANLFGKNRFHWLKF